MRRLEKWLRLVLEPSQRRLVLQLAAFWPWNPPPRNTG
nr:MAG TPA: hypothetical protein [Caudoviricetes sp.]